MIFEIVFCKFQCLFLTDASLLLLGLVFGVFSVFYFIAFLVILSLVISTSTDDSMGKRHSGIADFALAAIVYENDVAFPGKYVEHLWRVTFICIWPIM